MGERKVENLEWGASHTRTTYTEEADGQKIVFAFVWIKGREGYDEALARGHKSMDFIMGRAPTARLIEFPGYVTPIKTPEVRQMTAADLGLPEESTHNG